MNRRLSTWLEGEYHQCPHRGIDKETPLERWARVADGVQYPDAHMDLDDLFLFEEKRKVQNDRTVSLHGRLFEVDATLIGEKVTLRYDPSRPNASVQVVHEGRVIEKARQVDVYANCFVKRQRRGGTIDADRAADVQPSSLSMKSLDETGGETENNNSDDDEQGDMEPCI